MELRPQEFIPRTAAAVLSSLALGAALTPEVAQAGDSQHAESCMADYAKLFSNHGLSARVLGRRSFEVAAQPLDMHTTEPSCNDAGITRHTDVEIDQNGRRIALVKNLINPANDNGQREVRDVRTSRRIACNANEKVTFTTTAASSQAPGVVTSGRQSIRFRTACK